MTSGNDDIEIDAALVGELFDVPPAEVLALLKARAITSVCERGVDEHEGQTRLNFFYGNRRARVSLDGNGKVLRRSVIDFGEHMQPRIQPRRARSG
jgi:hypothetical protein